MDTLNKQQRALANAIRDLITAEAAADPDLSVGDVVIALDYVGTEASDYFEDCLTREFNPPDDTDDPDSWKGARR